MLFPAGYPAQLIMPHLLDVVHIRTNVGETSLEFSAGAKAFEVPLFGVPFEPQDETARIFGALSEFVGKAVFGSDQDRAAFS